MSVKSYLPEKFEDQITEAVPKAIAVVPVEFAIVI